MQNDDPLSAAVRAFETAAVASGKEYHDKYMRAGRGLLLAAAIQKGLGPGDVAAMAAQIEQATA